jgi:hypothetical protein
MHRAKTGVFLSVLVAGQAMGDTCGKPVAVAPFEQEMASVVSAFRGAAVVAWVDTRTKPYSAIGLLVMDSLGHAALGWPQNGLQLARDSSSVLGAAPPMVTLSDSTVMAAWLSIGFGLVPFFATIESSDGLVPPAASVTAAPIPNLPPGFGNPVSLARQDEAHALCLMRNFSGVAVTLVKQLSLPAAPSTGWPTLGIMLSDTIDVVPRQICSDGAGGCFVLVTRLSSCPPLQSCAGEHRVLHLRPDGSEDPLWPAGGAVVTTRAEWDQSGTIAWDRTNGVYVGWYQMVGDSLRVWGQHLDATGHPHAGWSPDGLELMPADDLLEYGPEFGVLSSGALVALIEVADKLPYLVCYTPDGTYDANWPRPGLLLRSAPSASFDTKGHVLRVTPDDHILAVWVELDAASQAVAGMAVDATSSPAPGWPLDGIRLCSGTAQKNYPAVALGPADDFIVAWDDARNDAADLYFDRYNLTDGSVPTLMSARFVRHSLIGHRLHAECLTDGDARSVLTVYHAIDAGSFSLLGIATSVASNRVTFDDQLPQGSHTAQYFLMAQIEGRASPISDTLRVTVRGNRDGLAVTCPSPQTGDALRIVVDGPAGPLTAQVFDATGRLLASRTSALADGTSLEMHFDMAGVRPGLYFVKLVGAAFARSQSKVVLVR